MKNVNELKEKFGLLIDLGIINVPSNYDHNNQIGNYFGYPHPSLPQSRDNITDSQYTSTECVLEPGNKIRARIFKNCSNYRVTTEECIDFLSSQGAIYVGVQGAILVLKEKLQILPPSFGYVSFYDSDKWSSGNVVFRIYMGEKYFWGLIRSKNRAYPNVMIDYGDGWESNIAFFCITKC